MRAGFLLLLGTGLWTAPAYSLDLNLCRTLFRWVGMPVTALSYTDTSYQKSREAWNQKLSGLSNEEIGKVVLKQMRTEKGNHPLTLMALVDHLNGNPEGHFSAMVEGLAQAGYPVEFRNTPMTHRLHVSWSKGLYWAVKKVTSRRQGGFRFLSATRDKIIVEFPKVAPKDASEAMDRIVSLSAAVAMQHLAMVARHAPLRSHPIPGGKYSFPEQALKAMHEAEVHIYTVLKTMEKIFPDAQPRVSKRDGIWKWKRTQLVLDILIRPFYPWYRPDKRMRPNKLTYAKFLEDLEKGAGGKPLTQAELPLTGEYAQAKYQSRFQLKWFADRYFTVMKGVFFVSLGVTAFRMAWGLFDNEFEVLPVPVPVGPVDGSPSEADLRNWIQYYEQSIDHLRLLKESQGDPDGGIEREIETLNEELQKLREQLSKITGERRGAA